jgi:hypothetical protein
MKLCQIRTVALALLLVLLPTVGQSQRTLSGTPIIVGDGSVHIISKGAHLPPPGSTNGDWDATHPKELHRRGLGATGKYDTVNLIGCNGNLSNCTIVTIQQLASFNTAKDICTVELQIGDSNGVVEETVTVKDEKGKQGMVITSTIGLTGIYTLDSTGTELKRGTDKRIVGIAIGTDSSVKPTPVAKGIIDNCKKTYTSCGVQIGYNY